MVSSPPDIPTASPPRRRRRFVLIYVAFLLALILGALRLVRIEADVWDYYYPEIAATGASTASQGRSERAFDILTLGGSVMLQVEDALEMRLQQNLDGRVRCFHLATTAHTSRDSWLKYRRLAGQKFDLVIVCHGINDVRMNYWSANQFRDDYTHCPWYANLTRDTHSGRLTLGARLLRFARQQGLGPPTAAEYVHGETLKTEATFEANLELLAREAAVRGDRVLLLSMPAHLPDNYTRSRFEAGELDYGAGSVKHPAELWGSPTQVWQGITAHNRRTRTVAGRHPHVQLVDLPEKISATGANFSDICHLTAVGRQRLVDAVAPLITEILGSRTHQRPSRTVRTDRGPS